MLPIELEIPRFVDPYEVYRTAKQGLRSHAQQLDLTTCLAYARHFTTHVIEAYWYALQSGHTHFLSPRSMLADLPDFDLDDSALRLATRLGVGVAQLDPIEAGYLIGQIYMTVLPQEYRARHGVYYTPPALTNRLLHLATEAGVDWQTCRVLDPACGGGAFLTPVALKIADALSPCEPKALLRGIAHRLQGIEIDAFSAWMSQVLLDAAFLDIVRAAGQSLPLLVRVSDSLSETVAPNKFDLVIGNPPYGRISLSKELRTRCERSLYGHANLYGLFTDLAVRWTRPAGIIAYVTPTSFLGGEYFKALRHLLAAEAPPFS